MTLLIKKSPFKILTIELCALVVIGCQPNQGNQTTPLPTNGAVRRPGQKVVTNSAASDSQNGGSEQESSGENSSENVQSNSESDTNNLGTNSSSSSTAGKSNSSSASDLASKVERPFDLNLPDDAYVSSTYISQTVTIETDSVLPQTGYYIRPGGALNPGTMLIALHGRTGLSAGFKKMLQCFAAAGYPVLAIDLYQGVLPKSQSEGDTLEEKLQARGPETTLLIAQASGYLVANMQARSIAVIGWDTGGKWALTALLRHPQQFLAAVNYYGDPLFLDSEAVKNVGRPFLSFNIHDDSTIDIQKVLNLKDALKQAGAKADIRNITDSKVGYMEPDRNANFFTEIEQYGKVTQNKPRSLASMEDTLQWLEAQLPSAP